MRSFRMGAAAVLVLCAVAGFGRPAIAGPNDDLQIQNQIQNQKHSRKQSGREARWEKQFEGFSKMLNLTDEQRAKIKPLFEDRAAQLKAVYSDKAVSKQEKQNKVQAIRSATEEKIEPLLTPDQMQKWSQQKQKASARTRDRRYNTVNRDSDPGKWRTHPRGNDETNWQARYERFSNALNLTDEQQAKIKPFFQIEAQQFEALRDDKSLSPEDRQGKVRQIHEATRDQIQPLLTPDQLQNPQWGAFQNGAGGQGEARSESPMPHPEGSREVTGQERFEQFSKTLSLTEDQQAKIKPLFEAQAEQLKAVYSDTSLSKQEKQNKVQAIHSATEEKIEPLLTPDQMEKWGEWKQKGWDRAEEQNEQQSGPAQDPNEKDPKEKDDSK